VTRSPGQTYRALIEGSARVEEQLDASIEREKLKNDFLRSAVAIVQAIAGGKIKCRIYAKKKSRTKAYISHLNLAVVGLSALVGLTSPAGLTKCGQHYNNKKYSQ